MIRYRIKELCRKYERERGEKEGELTFRKLGKLTGISPATLNKMDNGKNSRIDHHTIEVLLDFFDTTLEELVERRR